eukprot:6465651-Alexandrium_andersonii.AAC.1
MALVALACMATAALTNRCKASLQAPTCWLNRSASPPCATSARPHDAAVGKASCIFFRRPCKGSTPSSDSQAIASRDG